MSGKIIFFEERNFQGRSYECIGDCSEITSHLRRCSSCRVESGIFMVYEQPNYRGQQYLLTKGDYPEYQDTIGFNDCIRSCRIIPVHTGPFKMRIYEKTNFEGLMHELTDDCDSIQDNYNMSDLQSCNVMDGYWLMFELPKFEGRMLYLKPGEYKNLREISNDIRFNSIRRITEIFVNTALRYQAREKVRQKTENKQHIILQPKEDSRSPLLLLLQCDQIANTMGKIIFYEDKNFQGRSYECSSECSDLHSHFSRCNSIRVDSGAWMVYEKPNYMGYQYFLTKGDYPDYQRWMGFNDCVRSCRVITVQQGSHKMMIYERPDFGRQMIELTEDCPSLFEQFHFNGVHSCNVMDGHWLFYEHPHYRGRQYLLLQGQYRGFHEWGSMSPRVGSIRRITM
ncbi:LOW QUALITY PROTEIN: uncharacterized protein FYW61_021853 [Anableps anableps]